MTLTSSRQRALTVGAAVLGTALAWRAWKARHAYDFEGRTVIITGGSRGLGLAMAREFAAQGASLALLARDRDELERAVHDVRLHRPGTEVMAVVADVRSREETIRAVDEVVARYGHVDVLINNAGTIKVGPLEHMQLADYDDAMKTHFWGPLFMVLAVLPLMRQQQHGRIVNVSSIGGRVAVPHLVPYSASKFALAGLSEGLRGELARHGITVTTVYPGLMRTGSPLNASFKGRAEEEYAWFAIADSLPLVTMDARRAANQIIEACRRGRAQRVVTVQARLAILAHTVAPELFAELMAVVNRLLPEATTSVGDRPRLGRESESAWAAPSAVLTAPTYKAAQRNNQLPQ